MVDKIDQDFLNQNIKGLMMTLLARWNAQMDEARANTEFADIRDSDIRVFAQLRGRQIKLSSVHKEMGFSRQAAQQAIERLVAQGMVTLETKQDSKRDKLITITAKGQRWRSIAAEQIRMIETRISKVVGETERERFRGVLLRLVGLS